MKIGKDQVVSLDFEMRDKKGELIDDSSADSPLVYLHGYNNIPQGLEDALEGHSVGESLAVDLTADQAFGAFDSELVQEVNRSDISGIDDLTVGLQFPAETEEGVIMLRVLEIKGDKVLLDGNHPLAGEELHFNVTVREVRPATAEEMAHGHAHGPGGHHHH
ncbi:MAG: peptidylprolyl isomerase [Leptospiraceae bacterium]|nr:peptidylprolyl isomerase [Leptospiraceae bacterium]